MPSTRDLALLHALEQRGLGLRGGPVDLVADHDVGEHRARLELEVAVLRVERADPGDVAGQQVRGELDRAAPSSRSSGRAPWPAWSCPRRARPRSAGVPRPAAPSGPAGRPACPRSPARSRRRCVIDLVQVAEVRRPVPRVRPLTTSVLGPWLVSRAARLGTGRPQHVGAHRQYVLDGPARCGTRNAPARRRATGVPHLAPASELRRTARARYRSGGTLTVGECGVLWRPWGSSPAGGAGGGAGVSRHPYSTPRREGPAVPSGEVPGRAGRRAGDHERPGTLPLRLAARDFSWLTRPCDAPVTPGGPRLQPGLLRQRLRRDARQAGADHHPARAAEYAGWSRTASWSGRTTGWRSGTPRPGRATRRRRRWIRRERRRSCRGF